MRIKLIALVSGMLTIFSWAIFHQFSKKEALPVKLKLYALLAPTQLAHETQNTFEAAHHHDYDVIIERQSNTPSAFAQKVETMLTAIKENWGSIFMYCELNENTTVPQREAILKALEHTDLVLEQSQHPTHSFIACRANKRTLQLWQTIKHMMDEHPDLQSQDYLNQVLYNNKIAKLRWDYVPSSQTSQTEPLA
ncbi:MAG: hypothetical protein AB7F19_03925 [Candidatus Babeliales bacterium]